MMSARFLTGVIIALLAMLTACATDRGTPFIANDAGRVWPDAPGPTRIEYVMEFSSLSDFSVSKSFWRSLVDLGVGRVEDRMVRPMAVAATRDNKIIYVADPDTGCVHRYDLSRGKYTCLQQRGGLPLQSPVGVAVADDGRVFIADSGSGQILLGKQGGRWLDPLDTQVVLEHPTGVYWDEESAQLYVVDTGGQSVKAISDRGLLASEFGGRGNLPGMVNYPTYVWIDPVGDVLLSDSLNFRVQRFRKSGQFVRTFGENGDHEADFARPKGVATDSRGHVYVVDALFHAVKIFDASGTHLLSFGGQGQATGQFWLPNGIYISSGDLIYVADTHNKRVQVFRYVGGDT
jgi:sugar lactone lactonase YvrE